MRKRMVEPPGGRLLGEFGWGMDLCNAGQFPTSNEQRQTKNCVFYNNTTLLRQIPPKAHVYDSNPIIRQSLSSSQERVAGILQCSREAALCKTRNQLPNISTTSILVLQTGFRSSTFTTKKISEIWCPWMYISLFSSTNSELFWGQVDANPSIQKPGLPHPRGRFPYPLQMHPHLCHPPQQIRRGRLPHHPGVICCCLHHPISRPLPSLLVMELRP